MPKYKVIWLKEIHGSIKFTLAMTFRSAWKVGHLNVVMDYDYIMHQLRLSSESNGGNSFLHFKKTLATNRVGFI